MSRPAVRAPGPLADDLLRVVLNDGQGSLPRYGVRERAGAARRLDVVLRAALFCDLARAGLLSGTRGPVAVPRRPGTSSSGGHGVSDGGGASAGSGSASRGGASGTVEAIGGAIGALEATGGASGTVEATGGGGGQGAAGNEGPGTDVAGDQILAAVLAAVSQRPGVAWARWFRHIRDDRSALVARLVESGRWTAQGGHRFRDADPRGAERLRARAITVSELVEAPADERETMLGYLYALTGWGMTAEHVLGWEVRLARLDASPGGPTVRAVLAAAQSVNRRGRFTRR